MSPTRPPHSCTCQMAPGTSPKEPTLHWVLLGSDTEAVLGQGKTNSAHCSASKHPFRALQCQDAWVTKQFFSCSSPTGTSAGLGLEGLPGCGTSGCSMQSSQQRQDTDKRGHSREQHGTRRSFTQM